MTTTTSPREIFGGYREGLSARNNYLTSYLRSMPRYFRRDPLKEDLMKCRPLLRRKSMFRLAALPVVLCANIGERKLTGMPLETWRSIFIELSSFGVQTVTFSGRAVSACRFCVASGERHSSWVACWYVDQWDHGSSGVQPKKTCAG